VDTSLPILELGAVLLAAAAFGWGARRLGLPAVIGYLVVGFAAFQLLPGYLPDREQIQLLADVGVVLLLFEVGIELDVGRLRREHRSLLAASPAQIVLTTLLAGLVLTLFDVPLEVALVLGLCVAMSSSVVVVNITRSRMRRTDRPTEMSLLGWSLLQDLSGVIVAAVLLAFWQAGARPPAEALAALAIFGVTAYLAARLLPLVLARLRDEHDLFLIVSIAGGLFAAGVGAAVFGIPLALSAFVAGLVVADSPVAGEARRRLLPFRDVFAVLFFVAVGSLLEPAALRDGLPWVALFVVLMLALKTVPIYLLARLARLPRPAQMATGLSQLGEFSFVLVSVLFAAGAVAPELYAAVVAVVGLTIGASAVAVRAPVPGWRREPAPQPAGALAGGLAVPPAAVAGALPGAAPAGALAEAAPAIPEAAPVSTTLAVVDGALDGEPTRPAAPRGRRRR
jgi:monovalent cation:H+ antiporter-2, CPA2 family